MGVIEAVASLERAKREGASAGADKIASYLQRQNIKRLSKDFLRQGDLSASGRYNFMMKNGLDENTMNTVQRVTDLVLTGGVDLQGKTVGKNLVSGKTGDVLFEGKPEDYTLSSGAQRRSGTTNELIAENPKAETGTPSTLGKLFKELDQVPESDTLRRKSYEQAIAKQISQTGMKFTVDKDGNVTLFTNASQEEMTPGATTQTQKDVINLMGQLENLDAISGENAFKDVLTIQGKLYRKGLKIADSLKMPLSDENKEYLGKARQFTEGVEQIFNTYRKEITGAQAAIKELEMLRDSVINKKLTPTEFEYSLKRFRDQITRSLRLKRMLLRDGFTGKDLSAKLDQMITGGVDVSETEIDNRGDELKATGLSDADVVKQLRKEGYLE